MRRRTVLTGALGASLLQARAANAAAQATTPDRAFHMLLAGDTSFAESYAPKRAAARGYASSFRRLLPLLDQADYTVVNLETPLTDLRAPVQTGREYLHWSDRQQAPAALRAMGVDAVGLANNHTLDYGQEGLQQTFETLERHGLAAFGAGQDDASAAAPLLVAARLADGRRVTVAVIGLFEYRKAYDETYGFYAGKDRPGTNRLSIRRFTAQVAALRARIDNLYVIAFAHWGKNYAWRTPEQMIAGRALVDGGADMVIGHHGHAAQEFEFYRGRWILYGVGNFMFNAPGRFDDYPEAIPFGLPVDLAFAGSPRPDIRLYPVLSDNRVSDYQPRPATEAEARDVLARLLKRVDTTTATRVAYGADRIGPYFSLA